MDSIIIIRHFLEVVGLITTLGAVLLFIWSIISWFLGVAPLFYRLGFGRWSRRIAIVANDEMYSSLKSDLIDTGIFRKKNIFQVKKGSLSKIKHINLALIHYQSFSVEEVDQILADKSANAGFVFYFPEFTPPHTVIPQDVMGRINNHPFTTIVNMRGRLTNDILVTLLSTSYDKR